MGYLDIALETIQVDVKKPNREGVAEIGHLPESGKSMVNIEDKDKTEWTGVSVTNLLNPLPAIFSESSCEKSELSEKRGALDTVKNLAGTSPRLFKNPVAEVGVCNLPGSLDFVQGDSLDQELIKSVPGKIKPDLFGQPDNSFLQIFRNAYDRTREIYEPGLIPFIRREYSARLERMEAIKKELDHLYSIQAAYSRRRVKSEFRRFEEQAELWRQWFYHPLYLLYQSEETKGDDLMKAEDQKFTEDQIQEDDDIDALVDEYHDDLECQHSCDYYGTKKCRELCDKETGKIYLFQKAK